MASRIEAYLVTEGDQTMNVLRSNDDQWNLGGRIVDLLQQNGRGALPARMFADPQAAQDAAGTVLRALNTFLDTADDVAANG